MEGNHRMGMVGVVTILLFYFISFISLRVSPFSFSLKV